MYRSHFSLDQMPFGSQPNPAFFYAGGAHGELLDTLRYAITQDEGIVKVIGAAGSGKTMLCCMLGNVLPAEVDVVYLTASHLRAAHLIEAIAARLGLAMKDKHTDILFRLLHENLLERHAHGRKVVVLVDDAHLMHGATLEQIRLLTNLEQERSPLLTIALFGLPQLEANLHSPRMQRLEQRIMHNFEIAPISPQHVPALLACRLRAAGYAGPLLFNRDALDTIIQVSLGNMRHINLLAGKSLLAAFNDRARVITGKHVRAALTTQVARPGKWAWYVGAMLLALLLAAIAWPSSIEKSPLSKAGWNYFQ